MNVKKTYVSSAQMRTIDKIASQKYKIPKIILMENAGIAVAQETLKSAAGLQNKKICIVCGSGNNAGDGFVAARHLASAGMNVTVILSKPARSFKGSCRTNYEILKRTDIRISRKLDETGKAGIIIDALLGTGIKGAASGNILKAIQMINASKAYKISVDIPSGADADGSKVFGEAVKADKTVILALPKTAFKSKKIRRICGKIVIADIGIPHDAIRDVLKNEKN